MQLGNVKYGRSGAWAVNLWIKPTSLQGLSYSYVYSHNATTSRDNQLLEPNQVPRRYRHRT